MQLVMVGLGRMGANIARRLKRNGIEVIVFDVNPNAIQTMAEEGFVGIRDLAQISSAVRSPRVVWIMVPAEVTAKTIRDVAENLEPGDTIIDGGNSYYRDDVTNAAWLGNHDINFIDVGTSGGVFGLERGYSLMIGGEVRVVTSLTPIFAALAPGIAAAPRTPGNVGEPSTAEQGFLHCGPVGSGHFVKMVHNGIEYGAMAAYAEGLNLLDSVRNGIKHISPIDGVDSTTYDLDLAAVTEVWRRGSVVASWLLDLTAEAYVEDPTLSSYSGVVADSGEGRWTVEAAIEAGVPANVLSAALMGRFASRGNGKYANQLLSAMRKKFGGHVEAK